MKKKIFQNIFWTSVLILAVSLGLVIFLLYDHFTSVEQDSLAAKTQLAARGVEEEGETYLKSLNLQNARITWIAADGTVKYDSAADAETMENHSTRTEFQQALASGSGSSTRYSTTIGKRNFYYALKLKDGTVLRMKMYDYQCLDEIRPDEKCIINIGLAYYLLGSVDALYRFKEQHPQAMILMDLRILGEEDVLDAKIAYDAGADIVSISGLADEKTMIYPIKDGYFHESDAEEFRSAPYFSLRIDGIEELNAASN